MSSSVESPLPFWQKERLQSLEKLHRKASRGQKLSRRMRNIGAGAFFGDIAIKSFVHLPSFDIGGANFLPHDIPSTLSWLGTTGLVGAVAGLIGGRESRRVVSRTVQEAFESSLPYNVVPPPWALGMDSFLVDESAQRPQAATSNG